jgi:hypothetical protein
MKDLAVIFVILIGGLSIYSLGIYQGYSDGINSCDKR